MKKERDFGNDTISQSSEVSGSSFRFNESQVSGNSRQKNKNKSIVHILEKSETNIGIRDHRGIIFWGDNLSLPVIEPKMKDKDVILICCGNYHMVFATK